MMELIAWANSSADCTRMQYTPMRSFPEAHELDARVPDSEYERLLDYLDSLGMADYFWQEGGAAQESFIPAFDSTGV